MGCVTPLFLDWKWYYDYYCSLNYRSTPDKIMKYDHSDLKNPNGRELDGG